MSDLADYRLGLTKGYAYTKKLLKAVETGVIKNVRYVNQNDLLYSMLAYDRFDMFPAPKLIGLYLVEQKGLSDEITYLPKPFKNKPYYNIFAKASTHPKIDYVRANYDNVLKQLKREGFVDKILKKYGMK
ncbi:MAG: ABC transporter substrate-binding protein [Desulfobacteraceae bacterium]|nr:ABC transporter substrate-binding protein [Desulfobacteraceae bacterium]